MPNGKNSVPVYQKIFSWIDIIFGIVYGLISILGLVSLLLFSSFIEAAGNTQQQASVWTTALSVVMSIFFIGSGIYGIEKYKKGFSKFYNSNAWFLLAYGSFSLILLLIFLVRPSVIPSTEMSYLIFSILLSVVASVSITINGFFLKKCK